MLRFARSLAPAMALALALPALAPAPAVAQTVEITPFAGYRFGGEFRQEDDDFFEDSFDVEIDDGASFGAIVDVALVKQTLYLEITYSHQDTSLVDDSGLFEDDVTFFDLDVDVLHAGLSYQWSPGQVRPFVGFGLGVTRFSPQEAGFGSDERFSASISGGVKVMFNSHVGLRFQGTAISTFIDEEDEVSCNRGRNRCVRGDDTYLYQAEALAGLVIAF